MRMHGVRGTGALVSVLLALLAGVLSGCSDPVQQDGAELWKPRAVAPTDERWSGAIDVDSAGAISASGFNDLIDRRSPAWAGRAEDVAAELLGLHGPFDGEPKLYLLERAEGAESVLTVTRTRLGDDSVQAMRYRVVLHRAADNRYRFSSGKRTMRCQSGRGHQDFTVERCQ